VIITALRQGLAAPRQSGCERRLRVVAWDVNDAAQSEVIRELEAAGGQVLFRITDVTNAQDVGDGVARSSASGAESISWSITRALPATRQLIKWKDGAVAGTMTDQAFDAVISVNLKGVFGLHARSGSHMIRSGGALFSMLRPWWGSTATSARRTILPPRRA